MALFWLVLLALIGNGIKHTESGRVAVHCCLSQRDGSAMQLTVSDTGKGVIETDLDKIFDPHESCGDLPTSLKDCLGIGLPLVQRLVEENGGEITVASTPGLGTEFVLTIPVATHAR